LWSTSIKKGDPETNDGKLFNLCDLGRIKVGQKLHLVNQSLVTCSEQEDDETEHYFLKNRKKYQLRLNINGISLARETDKLGIQKTMLVPKSLSGIAKNATGTVVSLIDCFIVKKYPITFSEFKNQPAKGKANDKMKPVLRSVQTVEYLQNKYNQAETSYRPNFKLKVVDALKTYETAVILV